MKYFKTFEYELINRIEQHKKVVNRLFNKSVSEDDLKMWFRGYVSALEENQIINNDCLLRSLDLIHKIEVKK